LEFPCTAPSFANVLEKLLSLEYIIEADNEVIFTTYFLALWKIVLVGTAVISWDVMDVENGVKYKRTGPVRFEMRRDIKLSGDYSVRPWHKVGTHWAY
jgi:hypothetical protein